MNGKQCALWFFLVVGSFTNNAHGKLVITEVMINPIKAADSATQWFELYNTNTSVMALNKWRLRFRVKNELSSMITLTTTKSMAPYGYLVIGNNGNTASNGGVAVDVEVPFERPFPKDGRGVNGIILYPPSGPMWEDYTSWTSPSQALNFTPGASFAKISAISQLSDWAPSTSFINCDSGADQGTPGKINSYVCPTKAPTKHPTNAPTKTPTKAPTPTQALTKAPTKEPTVVVIAPKAADAPVVVPVAVSPIVNPVVPVAPLAAPALTPVSPLVPTSKKCGLFRLGIFCLNGCGIFGRAFGICQNRV